MASGYPRRDLRGALSLRFGIESNGGILKRSMTEMEKQQEEQNAIFLRSIKQKKYKDTPISPLYPTSSIMSSLSSSSALLRGHENLNSSRGSFPPSILTEPEKKSTITNRLLQLERQLLDDEDEEFSVSAGSAAKNSEWSETMQKLILPLPPESTLMNPNSSFYSPTTSSPSSSSSSASSSPSSSTTSRQMLLDTATAISEGNLETAATNLAILKSAANPKGSPNQRLAAMMVPALAFRINPEAQPNPAAMADVCSPEHLASSQMLYEASPCFKLGLMAANLAILEATKDYPKIHIIDFDAGQGWQLASFIHSLAERHRHLSPARPPPSVKITAFIDPTFPFNSLAGLPGLVGDRLVKVAEQLGIALRFSIVNRTTPELDRTALGCETGEALAVNFAFLLSRVADESVSPANPRDELLRRVKALGPTVVALVEQEMNGNTAPFAARFAEACAHYGALLESMEATAGRGSGELAWAQACLGRKACNSVAREGADRVQRCELYGKWRARLGMAGFKPVFLGPAVAETVRLRLASLGSNPGFMVKEEDGRVGCGWMGRVITVASAWH